MDHARHQARRRLARRSEALTAARLLAKGYAILARNVRVGRLEIDLVAEKDGVVVFCEVRSRTGEDYGHPAATIDVEKQQRIRRAAVGWIEANAKRPRAIRFDAAAVVFDRDERPISFRYYANAF